MGIFNLFSSIGQVSFVKIKYDHMGRSTGEAVLSFSDQSNTSTAVSSFNNRELDGLPMSVEIDKVDILSRLGQKSENSILNRLGPKIGETKRIEDRLGKRFDPIQIKKRKASNGSNKNESMDITIEEPDESKRTTVSYQDL